MEMLLLEYMNLTEALENYKLTQFKTIQISFSLFLEHCTLYVPVF